MESDRTRPDDQVAPFAATEWEHHLEQEVGRDVEEMAERRAAQDDILIAALAAGRTDEEAATLAGCSARTVRRRRKENPGFVTAVTEARAARVAQLAGRLVELGDRAREVIAECLDDDEAHVRLRAADLAQRSGERLHRASGVDAEIAELRALVNEMVAAHKAATADGSDKNGAHR